MIKDVASDDIPVIRSEADPVDLLHLLGTVRNQGKPILLQNMENLCGFNVKPAKPGELAQVVTAYAITSDDPFFHRLADGLLRVINHTAQQNSVAVNLHRHDTVLLVMKPDGSAELWLDAAAQAIRFIAKRVIAPGTVVFSSDIADITSQYFPCVEIAPSDKVLCIFREGWRFGMVFDFNPDQQLNLAGFEQAMGTLVRELRYRHLYEALGDETVFSKLVSNGWFPFVEIIAHEANDLIDHCTAGFELADLESRIVARFDEARLQSLLNRWAAKPHLASRMNILTAGIKAFKRGDPIGVIKILLSEIEGMLREAYRTANEGKSAKLKLLLEFAMASASSKVGGSNTLMFPVAFAEYLQKHTYADFDPNSQEGAASSRHAVNHGAAQQDSYTMPRALQAILTLDQLAFYT
jgi:hypothetical protein